MLYKHKQPFFIVINIAALTFNVHDRRVHEHDHVQAPRY
jgi:hypothetical protein